MLLNGFATAKETRTLEASIWQNRLRPSILNHKLPKAKIAFREDKGMAERHPDEGGGMIF